MDRILDDKDIMKQFLDFYGISANALATKLGYSSSSTIYHILRGDNNLSDQMIDKILVHYPNANFWFLKRGQLPIENEDKSISQSQRNLLKLDTDDFAIIKMQKDIAEIKAMFAELLEIARQK